MTLKPCPFCGEKAIILKREFAGTCFFQRFIGCKGCQIWFPYGNGSGKEKWNKRVKE